MVVDRVREIVAGADAWFWLDGEGDLEHPVSYVGVASQVVFAERGHEHEFLAMLSETAAGAAETTAAGAAKTQINPGSAVNKSGAPLGFSSGWVIALGYEFGVGLMGLPPHEDSEAPAFALRVDRVVELRHTVEPNPRLGCSKKYAIGASSAESPEDRHTAGRPPTNRSGTHEVWRMSANEYEAGVAACREAIREGDAYVLCLTDTATVRFGSGAGAQPDPLSLYARLRAGSPALRGGVIVAGQRALVSASPERFLSVRNAPGGRHVSTHPIKGTRPRGATVEADDSLRAELAADPKERAENLMIVDLMRNDLSRVCAPATVRVSDFLRIESHPHVHQLVSTVEGTMRLGAGPFEAIAACFPGGSMTGAPKRRAIEILSSLERHPRGLYSGCFGWVSDRGEAELAMSIRGIELRRIAGSDPEARIGAGGGVTVDSDPVREHAEKNLKAAAVLSALYS